jgi:hypothetical protein
LPLADLRGERYTRLHHDTYVASHSHSRHSPRAGGHSDEPTPAGDAFDHDQWSTDIARREELDGLRWRLVVIESDGIYADPLRTLQRVRDALAECGVRVPRVFKAEWTRHFVAYR